MNPQLTFSPAALKLNAAAEATRICAAITHWLTRTFRRRGVVVGVSGGIDSSVAAALCVEALGPERVLGLLMPERDSSADTLSLGELVVEHLNIAAVHENITPMLEAVGCYQRRDEAIRTMVPEYGPGYRCKIVLPSLVNGNRLRVFSIVVQTPDGTQRKVRLTHQAYLGVVAASNFKQRIRKMLEYYHADRLNYAVTGTPNRLEYDQGFFVKVGDGAADFKPIAHLYKTQVYQMAEYLRIPMAVRQRRPMTDTYSLPQSQEEFYFSLPYHQMDVCLYGQTHHVPAEEIAACLNLSPQQVEWVYRDIRQKRSTTRYLHLPPQLVEPLAGVGA